MAGEKETLLAQFLRTEVPDWEDEVVSRARYKGFTGQRADWEHRLQFWKDLVVKCAYHLNLVVLDPNMVQHQWFLREGVTPMGMSTVLTEMRKSGELQTKEELLRPRATLTQYTGSMLRQALVWMGSQVRGTSGSTTQPASAFPDRLIVTPLLQERISLIIKVLSEVELRHACVVTMMRFQEFCGCPDTADIVMGVLLFQGKARYIKLGGKDNIEGLKISVKDGPVADATEADSHVLQLHWTMERLQQQLHVLNQRVASSRGAAVRALKTGDKQAALRHARRLKILLVSKGKCETFMDRIDEVLTLIADAEATKKVTDAVRVGTQAMKENHVTLTEVHTCLEELDDAISQQRETQESLAEASLTTDPDDAGLEEEFELLQAEMDMDSINGLNDLPEAVDGGAVVGGGEPTNSDTTTTRIPRPELATTEAAPEKDLEDGGEDEEALERAFAKLKLELA